MPNNDGKNIEEQDVDLLDNEPATLEAAKTQVKGILNNLRSERKKRQELETKLQAIEDKEKTQEEEKLKAQGELQKLVDAKQKEIDDLKSQMQSLKVKADAYDELEVQERTEAKKKLGDKWDEDYNDIPIKTLRKIISTISIESAINVDGGGGIHNENKLTDEEKSDAKSMGLSDEAYKKFKKTREEIKRGKENKFTL